MAIDPAACPWPPGTTDDGYSALPPMQFVTTSNAPVSNLPASSTPASAPSLTVIENEPAAIFIPTDRSILLQAAGEVGLWYRRAASANAFAVAVTTTPQQVRFSSYDRLATALKVPRIAPDSVWYGFNVNVSPANGIPITPGAAEIFGPEGGQLIFYVVTSAAGVASGPIDLRALELIPPTS